MGQRALQAPFTFQVWGRTRRAGLLASWGRGEARAVKWLA
jgi:hypothetical protein